MGMVKNVLKSVFKSITILSRPYFSLEENELKFKVDTDTFFKFPITNVETKTRYDSYILEAYTLSADNIYLEYIHTDIDVSWNGQALSFFVTLLKDSLKTRHIVLLERFEFNHYEFLSYNHYCPSNDDSRSDSLGKTQFFSEKIVICYNDNNCGK